MGFIRTIATAIKAYVVAHPKIASAIGVLVSAVASQVLQDLLGWWTQLGKV